MARKRLTTRKYMTDETDNNDRWLISFADLMTTMFAFFVVLYAMSSVQEKKFEELSTSLSSALGMAHPPKVAAEISPTPKPEPTAATAFTTPTNTPIEQLPPAPPTLINQETANLSEEELREHLQLEQEKSQMQDIAHELQHRLARLVNEGKVRVSLSNWGISVEINASILFEAAEAKLDTNAYETLISIAEIMRDQPQSIHVAGHTDNKAIKTGNFPSNWELSSARAGSVVRLLIDAGIDAKRLAAIGYADNQPVASNDTYAGRMRNRRVQIYIMAKSAVELESINNDDLEVP